MSVFKTERLAVISLRAGDVPLSVHFYRDILGLDLLPHHDHRPAFDLGGGTYLVILKGTPVPPKNAEPARFPLLTFAVRDLDAAVEHLGAHGVELPWGVESREGTRWVMFYDPAGNLIELAQFSHESLRA